MTVKNLYQSRKEMVNNFNIFDELQVQIKLSLFRIQKKTVHLVSINLLFFSVNITFEEIKKKIKNMATYLYYKTTTSDNIKTFEWCKTGQS